MTKSQSPLLFMKESTTADPPPTIPQPAKIASSRPEVGEIASEIVQEMSQDQLGMLD